MEGLAITLLVLVVAVSGKRVINHLDWKEDHGETLHYGITFKEHQEVPDLSDFGLVVQEPCLHVDYCHIYSHHYQIANGTCKFSNTTCQPIVRAVKNVLHKDLDNHEQVVEYSEIWQRARVKRGFAVNDVKFDDQWHLTLHANLLEENHIHLNLSGVWQNDIAGQNVNVAVVDDGLEWDNPDLHDNYLAEGSLDVNDKDDDPMPDERFADKNPYTDHNQHGTRCAGEIAAVANNSICGVGVAYKANIAGVRALGGPMTDLTERAAFTAKLDVNHVYTCSWGPNDDGITVDGPHTFAARSVEYAVRMGRNGYGAVYVVASGNGGEVQDNCNFDGYANSIYFVTIGAILADGHTPPYSELCAPMLAVAPSGGRNPSTNPAITTTDIRKRPDSTGCTNQHSGTSAAAPLGAAVIALLLSSNPCLTWRDIQHLIILTSHRVVNESSEWNKNSAGLFHSHYHGFGLLSAWNLVNAAKIWHQMPAMITFTKPDIDIAISIKHGENIFKYTVTPGDLEEHGLNVLEHVQVKVTIDHPHRGNLYITLKCPDSMQRSILASYRDGDQSGFGFRRWTFSTVRCWGENPAGEYVLNITDRGRYMSAETRRLNTWSLTLRGSTLTTTEYGEIIEKVRSASSGFPLENKINHTCYPPPVDVYEPHLEVNSQKHLLYIIAACGVVLVILVGIIIIRNYMKTRTRNAAQYVEKDDKPNIIYTAVDGTANIQNATSIAVNIDESDEDAGTETASLLQKS